MTVNTARGGNVWTPASKKLSSSPQKVLNILGYSIGIVGFWLLYKTVTAGVIGITYLPSLVLTHKTYSYSVPFSSELFPFLMGVVCVGIAVSLFNTARYGAKQAVASVAATSLLIMFLSIVSIAGAQANTPINSLPSWVENQIGNSDGVPTVNPDTARKSTTELKDTYGNKYILTVTPGKDKIDAMLVPEKK